MDIFYLLHYGTVNYSLKAAFYLHGRHCKFTFTVVLLQAHKISFLRVLEITAFFNVKNDK